MTSETHYLVLVLWLTLVFSSTLIAFCKFSRSPNQIKNTLIYFTVTLISPLMLMIGLARLYLYAKESQGGDNE